MWLRAHPKSVGSLHKRSNSAWPIWAMCRVGTSCCCKRVAVLRDFDTRSWGFEWAALDQAARELGLSPVPADIKSPDELETAFANIDKERGRGPFCDPYSPHL